MKKRIVSLFLCVVMLFSLLGVTAYAEGKVKFEAQNVKTELATGATVKVAVNITENPGLMSGSYCVKWDKTALELTAVEFLAKDYPDASSPAITENNGEYWVSFGIDTATESATFTGKAFDLTFKVLAGAEAKTYAITLAVEDDGLANADADLVAADVVAGSITLTAKPVAVTGVTLNPTSLSLEEGASAKLTATVNPDNATDKTVTWTVKPEGIVTVAEDGTVTAVKAGKATITATAGGKKATCAVTVTEKTCDHADKEYHAAVDATCTEAGNVEYWSCKNCSALFTKNEAGEFVATANVTIPALGHKVDGANMTHHDAVAPDCKNDGNVEYWTCSDCGNNFVKDKKGNLVKTENIVVKSTGKHSYDWENPTDVTVGSDSARIGVVSAACTGCGELQYKAYLTLAEEDCLTIKVVKDAESTREVPKGVKFTVEDNEYLYTFVTAGGDESCNYYEDTYYESGLCESAEAAIADLKDKLADGVDFQQTTGKKSGWTLDTAKYHMDITFDGDAVQEITFTKDGKPVDGIVITNIYKATKSSGGFKDPDGVYKDLMDDGKVNGSGTKDNGKTIKSSKTFDAGIGLYVGLSILSLTGSAVVIGKKKVR